MQFWESCEFDSKEISKRRNDYGKYAKKVIECPKTLSADIESFVRNEQIETDKVVEFTNALKNAQKTAFDIQEGFVEFIFIFCFCCMLFGVDILRSMS